MTLALDPARRRGLKQSFATRRVPVSRLAALDTEQDGYLPGDLVLARVDEIGQHGRIELTCGRRAILFAGDEIVLAAGHRYAPDQFEGRAATGPGPAQMIAAGGIAGYEDARHQAMRAPTAITILGAFCDQAGSRVNLADHAVSAARDQRGVPVIAVCGTSMNSGKTFTAAHLAHGYTRQGLTVGALKLTGTGAGGDLWRFRDAGAHHVADFTDAGMPTTYRLDLDRVVSGAMMLIAQASLTCDVIVCEVADGLRQRETAALLQSPQFRDRLAGVVFCSGDALGAEAGVTWLRNARHEVRAISGLLTRAPLAVREAESATGFPCLTPDQLLDPGVLEQLRLPPHSAGAAPIVPAQLRPASQAIPA